MIECDLWSGLFLRLTGAAGRDGDARISAPLGMTFGNDGCTSQILDPKTGLPTAVRWRAISFSAPTAALADALSTAACLTKVKDDIAELCHCFTGTRIESATNV